MAWRWSVCGTAEVVWKPRFLWQRPSAHLHFLVSCFSFSSWKYPIDSVWGSGMVSLLTSQAHWHHGHLTNFWCFWQCGQGVDRGQILLENEISIFKKLVSRRKYEVLQDFLVNGCSDIGFQKTQWTNTSRWHCTPNHHRLWKLNTGLQATWAMSFSTFPPDSRTLVSKWNQTEWTKLRDHFEGSGNLCRCFELISWLACHHILICWDSELVGFC